jgi:hypothetical protein
LKRVETRHWSTKYRGELAIHSSKKDTAELREIAIKGGLTPSQLPFGQVVAIVTLVDILPIELLKGAVMPIEEYFGDYRPNRFGWILCNVRPIKPFPFKGGQGFFNIPDELFK